MPIAAAVLGLSTKKYDGMSRLDPASLKRGKDEQQLALTYFGGPLAPDDSDRTRTLRVGDRMPDAVLTGEDGQHVRLFDVFRGPHFTAVAHGPHAVHALSRLEWPSTGARLKRIAVGSTTEGVDEVLSDSAGTLGSVHGLTEDTLLLVRPDGCIGHISTEDFLTSARTVIRTMTPAAGSRTGSTALPGMGDGA